MAEQPQFNTILREIFPYTSHQTIADVITMVEEQNPLDSFDGKIENMINLLSGDGAQGPMPVIAQNNTNNSTGTPLKNVNLYRLLIEIYPDADRNFLQRYCQEKEEGFDYIDALDDLQELGYEKDKGDPLKVWEMLMSALPEADPTYLKKEAERLVNLDPIAVNEFVQNAITNKDYPTMSDYLKRKKEAEERSVFINFNMETFLELFPNPFEVFGDPKRKSALDENSNEADIEYSLTFLYNHYKFIRKVNINQIFQWNKKNLMKSCDRLDRIAKNMNKPRPMEKLPEIENVALLQEIAFLKNRKMIKNYLKMKDEYYRAAKEEARKAGLLETCQCCYDEELIPEECFVCLKNCIFCKDCVKTGTETEIGNGQIRIKCFANCDSEFSLQTLQMVLPRKIFEKLAQKITSEEIKKANVEGLETCPFCNFAMVLPDCDKIFKCINEECQIESCRECKHKSHIPLKCDEVEYDEDVRRRTYIENKMTEALTRTCYNCQKTFVKTNGCNKMTCFCGAKMCYLCGAAINGYNHFSNTGCPLFTNDNEINLRRILQNADKAKEELGDVRIKFDPSTNIREYYQ